MCTESIRFQKSRLTEMPTFKSYLASLSSPIDSFLEDHIFESEAHRILYEDKEVGCVAVHKGTLLTVFHVVGGARRLGQRILLQAVAHFNVRSAFVPTCDEFFLSHAADAHTSLDKQAYFFIEGDAGAEPAETLESVRYRPATQADVAEIVAASGDFLDKPAEMAADGQIHVGHLDEGLVALGIVVPSRLFDRQASIGVFTRESHRRRGIGVNTIVH
ncbi:MAG: hypothetical protein RDV41_15355, partial [Planctomycetota bacterium]|nr:hypothetical protein [Planctomycetota bacterium]